MSPEQRELSSAVAGKVVASLKFRQQYDHGARCHALDLQHLVDLTAELESAKAELARVESQNNMRGAALLLCVSLIETVCPESKI